ncbi:MAG: YfhO family protein [Candidatus Eisenbacteria bacterium]
MNGTASRRTFLLLFTVPLALLALFSMDLAPGRYLITFRADRYAPWGPESPGEPSFNADCIRSYYPRRVLATEALRAGRVPLWDPTSFCGQPFLANFQSGVFYPVNLALLPFSPARQMGIFVWLHLVLAGWGGALLFRGMGRSLGGGLVGGLLYATGGALAVRTGQPTMLAAAAWLPLLAHVAGRTAEGKGSLALFGLVYAGAILAGFPPILIWSSLLAGAWALHRWWGVRAEAGNGPVVKITAGFLLGVGIAAAQLLPTAELAAWSDRVRFAYPALVSSSWHPAALVRMIAPDFFGTPFDGDSWIHLLLRGDAHYWQSYLSTAAYVGVGALVFAAAGFGGAWRDRSGRFLVLSGIVAALILLGTPLLRVVSALPLAGGARVDRIVHVALLALTAVAAFGFDRWREGKGGRTAIATAFLLGLATAALYFGRESVVSFLAGPGAVSSLSDAPHGARAFHASVFLFGSAALFLVPARFRRRAVLMIFAGGMLVLDPALVSRPCHVTVGREELPRETEEIRLLREWSKEGRIVRYRDPVLPPNLPGLFGIEDVAGYNALNIRDYREYYESFAPESVRERRINPLESLADLGSGQLAELGARWIITQETIRTAGVQLRFDGPVKIYENLRAGSRAVLAGRVVRAVDGREAERVLAMIGGRDAAVFEEKPPALSKDSVLSGTTVGGWLDSHGGRETSLDPSSMIEDQAKIVSREPERVVVDCAATRGRLLLLRDPYFPGWVATVDGERAEILKTNRIFRGVVVPPGVHRVEFRYDPRSFRTGAAITQVSLLIAALLLFFRRFIFLRRGSESR